MTRTGFIARLVMIAACLVPFTSTRQAGALLALKPTVPVQSAPVPQEDDSEREENRAGQEKERAAQARPDQRPSPGRLLYALPSIESLSPRAAPRAAPAPTDHFRNGLGSPYRC
jgi:hypothetical protein